MTRFDRSKAGSIQFLTLCGFLILVFLIGGGARGDIESLALLRPVAVLVCAFALTTMRRHHLRTSWPAFALLGAAFALVLLHLLPLPPALWQALPGRETITQIAQVSDAANVWRPLSMAPDATRNALYSLFVPLAVLLLGVQLSQEERFRLLPLMIALGALSGLIGLLQVAGPTGGPLYFYDITNGDSAVGLFANRNHASVFLGCLFPMLAIYASAETRTREQFRLRTWLVVSLGALLVPLILVAGSRTGLFTGLLGLLSIPLLVRSQRAGTLGSKVPARSLLLFATGAICVAGLGLLFTLLSKDRAIDRLLTSDTGGDRRFEIWGPVTEMARQYQPLGSGIGSYVEVFQLGEPRSILTLNYSNHAHNDLLETWLTGGVPALALLAVAILLLAWRALHLWRRRTNGSRRIGYARMASVVVALLLLASLSDYPLRVPSIMCLIAVCTLWLLPEDRSASIAA